MILPQRILEELGRAPARGLDDDQLAQRLNVIRQAVNQACRRLAAQGRLIREVGPRGKIVNRLPTGAPTSEVPESAPVPTALRREAGELISEDEVKAAVRAHLETAGYQVSVAWGRSPGVDIDAKGPDGRLLLEAKGEVVRSAQQVNYFLGAIGELLQRLSDPDARYGLALPDNKQYRGLVQRLPDLVWERLRLVVFFVGRVDEGFVVRRHKCGASNFSPA